ncbi:zinc finger FYVE domain-containing protein 26 homolog [Maniola jurtina]|uniref:zinc finger FYVE domain-containing protein 26 homolog n=1 Tax=Maniola jurtina TaxID=191418 RepID=UPI001E68930E|nr:zinc finger FYVE domain-containing protein 26 homolog [Maniola jurtina]XP_045776575.1 zinc finger FYVE domain-containing protein 26 homolog [Maniola jurtina]
MKEEELKYNLRLLDELTVDIFKEILQIFYATEESQPVKELSDQALEFLGKNLKSNPVTTSTVLNFLQSHTTDTNELHKIQLLYLDVLKTELTNNCPDRVITILSLARWDDKLQSIFVNDIFKHFSYDIFRQHRKQILISLVTHSKPELINIASDMMHKNESQKHFKLTAEYMIELCYQDKTHWLLKAAQIYKQQLQDMKNVTFEINNFTKQILIMVLIDLTNSPETYDLPSLVNQLTNIFSILDTYTTTDHQLQFYMTEVKRELTVIKFCLENNCKIMSTSIFSQVLSQSALTVISQVCRLSKVDRYKVSRLLNTNNDFITELLSLSGKKTDQSSTNWDISTYNSYCAITKVIDAILNSSESLDNTQEMSTSLDDIKRLVLSIQPLQYCIEVIETIFACLFLRYEYFSCYEHNQEFPCGTHSECSYFYSKKQNKNSTNINSSSTGFMCNALTTQIILNTLKLCLETLKEKGNIKSIENDDPNTFARYKRLVNVVNHSIWKMQLVSTLSPDTSPLQLKLCLDYVEVDESSEDEEREFDPKVFRKKPKMKRRHTNPKPEVEHVMLASTVSASEDAYSLKKNTIDFISIMLAKPNCLVALALYQNDFSKANQILEMFDLSDSEIATEVTFTEQLRHLVAKIKNIICYRDCSRYPSKELSALSVVSTEVMGLVEGFLASNRAPNSFDIIELGSRHPHLQLYNHQNAPFINAVDILLSSGLNREITYGLINVVERKLAEVRCSTDVTAVKKTNYIRFVEDIASVTFEIFGNTEKSFDFVDNVCELVTDCRIPIKHKDFCKLNQLSKELRQCCLDLADIVNPTKETVIDENLLQKYHQIYMNVVAASDKDLCNIGEVSRHGNKKARVHYLRKCYMYAKSVAQLEQEDRQNESSTEAPYFAVLERQLHDIFGNMINNKEMPVTYLEPICKKLNVNLIPKLILNFCPSITLAGSLREASEENFNNLLQVVFNFKNLEEKLFVEPTADFAPLPRTPDPQCLTYVVLHNWVLAHIIRKIHSSLSESTSQHSIDARTKYLNKYMDLERFDNTKVLFANNKCLASLHTIIDLDKLFLYMPQLLESGKILQCLKIIDALSERQLMCSANLMNLRDLMLFKIATNPKVPNCWKYCQYLKCSELKFDLILNNLSCWPAEGAMEAIDYLRFILDQTAVEEGLYEKCNEWKVKIPIYEQISSIMGANHWHTIYEKSIENPESIIEVLMDSQQFKLCLEWADTHEVSEHMKNLIVVNLLRQFFEYTNQATPSLIQDLLTRLPSTQALDLVADEISKIRNIEILQVCIDFLSQNSTTWRSFGNIKIGFQIMLEIEANSRHLFWDLIEKPLLMLEQLLMNGKLEMLAQIINKISPNLENDLSGDNLYYNIKTIETLLISRNAVDSLLRYYAEKALDMKNPRHTCPSPPKPWDESLLQSIDSINIEAASKPFMMPEHVPSKEQWVEDYTVDRCMLCKISIFSMIIRRHHCRRCGRLVCHACSRSRMQVPSYPSGVKFRVCDDCYTQTMNRKTNSEYDNLMLSSNSDSAGSGTTCMDWCLSTNATKNEAVRAEFSYEFTPNVTLCLSIMKMHTISLDYPRFLLDRSDEVARELANGGDSRLLVRARRSLLLAAAELYSRAPNEKSGGIRVAETGAAHATRCLAHADAMATLVKHQAHHLVPHQGAHPSQIVRSLLEAEKWELALEIATKSGLPRNSVLAAWGKACLKAGCFKEARRKFALCFKNTPICVDFDEVEYGKEASEFNFVNRRLNHMRSSERSISTSSVTSEGRGRSNPPLLNEIISMLEDMNYPVNQQLLDKAETIKSTNERLSTMNTSKKKIQLTEPALNIMHMLASVKKIKQGDYSDFQTAIIQPKKTLAQELLRRNNHTEIKIDHSNKKLDPFFYKECIYYLSNYGSHVANIMFYMKHSNLREVIRYCYDNMVEKETFTESVYMECLKRNKVNDLLKAMADIDSTLEMWSEYIMHICRTLEISKKLDALYALQCGTGQHARASASCALLYSRPIPPGNPPFAVLQARQHHLAAALHHLSQCVPVTNRINDPKSIQFHLDKVTIDNLMTTMSRQMELAKYLAACEASGRLTEKVVSDVIPAQGGRNEGDSRPLTLFGSNTDKIRIVALVLAGGLTVESGFDLAFKIVSEHKLDSMNIYIHVAKYLVNADRFMEVKTLAKCIRGSNETAASLMSDQVLEAGTAAVVARCEARGQLHDEQAELLITDICSHAIKISCYLVCRNVSSAYILAAKHERTNDLRKVLHEAERLGNEQVRNACLKRLTSKNILA